MLRFVFVRSYLFGRTFLVRICWPSFGFPGGSVVKNLPTNAGDMGSVPKSGRSPREENSNPLQYSCLGNPMDRGAWWATAHRVKMSETQLATEQAHTHIRKTRGTCLSSHTNWTPSPAGPGSCMNLSLVDADWCPEPLRLGFLASEAVCLTGAEREGTHCWYLNQVSPKTEMKIFSVRQLDCFQGCCAGQKKCQMEKQHSFTCSLFYSKNAYGAAMQCEGLC